MTESRAGCLEIGRIHFFRSSKNHRVTDWPRSCIKRTHHRRPPVPESLTETIHSETIERKILLLRGQKIMLSTDLAMLYGVEPKVLMQAIKRNGERFPPDFMFQLTNQEVINLKSHFVTSSWGGIRRALPYAFTEQGVAMVSSVLKSRRAALVNVEIMRSFVRLRRLLATHAELARALDALEKRYDHQFKIVFDAIRALMAPPPAKTKKIGFDLEKQDPERREE